MWSKIILFGDSHTQMSFDPANGCWGALLADKFQRISDVIPRGFSGYNTRWCRIIMPEVFKPFDPKQVACVTILLGSNDSVPENSPSKQHVPLEEYKTNLSSMIDYLKSIGIDNDKIILIAPPNFHIKIWNEHSMKVNGFIHPDSWNQNIPKYIQACKDVADQKQISFLDLYKIFIKVEDNEKLFADGLHLSSRGAALLFKSLFPIVSGKVTKFTKKSLEDSIKYPDWKTVDRENPSKSLMIN